MNSGYPKRGLMYRLGQLIGVLLVLASLLTAVLIVKLLWLAVFS